MTQGPASVTLAEVPPALYNEIDPYAVRWLRNLSATGRIAKGAVDALSIEDLEPALVAPFRQFHAFAGIGAWSYALRLAGVPDDAAVWTGSCPCQPFSCAGNGRGTDDPRHLWPAWFRLIRECRPPVVFGEQVASPAGRAWLDVVSADLEGVGYAVGAADLCAAGVGAPHIRQRLYFVAHVGGDQRHARWAGQPNGNGALKPSGLRDAGRMGEPDRSRSLSRREAAETMGHGGPVDSTGGRGETRAPWHPADWLPCRDGKLRPVEPGTFPLAHGAPARVGRLRAYGNAIVPQVAAAFVRAALSAIVDSRPTLR